MKLASDVQRQLKRVNRRLIIALTVAVLLLIGTNVFWAYSYSRANAQFTYQQKVTVCQTGISRQHVRKRA